jgi:hypothetical protein
MTQREIDYIIDEVRENRERILDVLQRLVRVEERTSRKATIYGLIGGAIIALPPLFYWLAS